MLVGLANKTVLVTGAAGAIGSAAVARFAAEGCCVVAADLNREAAEAVARANGDHVTAVAADVASAAGAAECVEAAIARTGQLDLAFVNAGVECVAAPIANFDAADYERVFAVNVKGAFLTCQAVVRYLLGTQRPGGILLTSSVAGLQGSPLTSIYSSSKHAVIGLGRSLAPEVGAFGIRVNVLCPGAVDSRMMRSLEGSIGAASSVTADDIRMGIQAHSSLGRYATPAEIASTAAWILSDEVPFAHGEIFTVSGGLAA